MSIPHDHLLSARNPVANREQCAAEETALRILQLDTYRAARRKVAFLWRLAYGEDETGYGLVLDATHVCIANLLWFPFIHSF